MREVRAIRADATSFRDLLQQNEIDKEKSRGIRKKVVNISTRKFYFCPPTQTQRRGIFYHEPLDNPPNHSSSHAQ